ncbi:hypothetical protein MKQ70_32305 [Chitinophaga sedimenti]|uniref:hypothetical protein n=1 Tax=Chitinophaga sedimenti TaxID=2033606 RepID=UPI0020049F7D|nr:hypothetical protein [Chitinophaga sedimenti]MCK7559400.1 hypothetical protein [Chitinophaga sedimenti]
MGQGLPRRYQVRMAGRDITIHVVCSTSSRFHSDLQVLIGQYAQAIAWEDVVR